MRSGIAGVAAAGEELGLEIGIGQAEILEIEHVGLGALLQPQRIEIGDQVAAIRVDLNQARHRALFGARDVGGPRRAPPASAGDCAPRQQPLAESPWAHFGGRICPCSPLK